MLSILDREISEGWERGRAETAQGTSGGKAFSELSRHFLYNNGMVLKLTIWGIHKVSLVSINCNTMWMTRKAQQTIFG